MRVRGDNAPSNAFSLEEQPNKPGVALVRFYENAEPFEEKRDELTTSGWVYDEYLLELADTGSLSEDVLANFDTLLAQAKAAETPAEQGDLESRVTTLEETSASKDDVQAVWDRMAAAYNEGVNEA